jgi:aspartate carbamoyltransferase regulatory subunit
MTVMEKTLPVSAIRKGTVIDHIAAGKALKIVKLLKLSTDHLQVTLGLNLPSSQYDYKDLIKVEEMILSKEAASQVAILSPQATINLIDNYEVYEKFNVSLPECIRGILRCSNTLCVSNHEPIESVIHVKQRWKGNVQLQCHYCRKNFSHQDI